MNTFAPYMHVLREVVGEGNFRLAVEHLTLARKELSAARIRTLEEEPSASKQKELLDAWFGPFIHDAVKNLILVLIRDRVLPLLIDSALPEAQPRTARVTSAHVLDEDTIAEVRTAIGNFAEQTEITFAVDKNMIGGMRIEMGDRLIDASIERTLAELMR